MSEPVIELRVHGIGGPSAASVLGLAPGAGTEAIWTSDSHGRSAVRIGDRPHTAVYHWAPLTSGSRWFALWPLLLPFTVLNVAGFMHAPGLRAPLARLVIRLLALMSTVSFVGWLVVGGQVFAHARGLASWTGAVGAGVLVAVALTVAQRSRRGFEALVPPGGRRPWRSRFPGLRDGWFFAQGRQQQLVVVVHVVAVALTVLFLVTRTRDGATLADAATLVVAVGGTAQLLLLVVYAVMTVRRAGAWSLAAAGAAGAGAALIGGLIASSLLIAVPPCAAGEAADADEACVATATEAFASVDLYGFAVLVALGVGTALAVKRLLRPAPGEATAIGAALLGGTMARVRARVAVLAPALAGALGAAAVAFVLAAAIVLPARAPETAARWCGELPSLDPAGAPCDRLSGRWCGDLPVFDAERWPCTELPDAGDGWRVTNTPLVGVARFTFFGLLGFVLLNLLKSKLSAAQLRRVGSIWDVLTFWPRTFHPFAVRPYAERAVPELQRLFADPGGAGPAGELAVRAHSQGSVLCVAALAGAPTGSGRVRSLLTFGSPLRSLYCEAFPAYVNRDLIEHDVPRPPLGWRNVFRFTDHVGRAVFVDDGSWDPDTPGDDRALADPPTQGQPVDAHNRYFTDPRLDPEDAP